MQQVFICVFPQYVQYVLCQFGNSYLVHCIHQSHIYTVSGMKCSILRASEFSVQLIQIDK